MRSEVIDRILSVEDEAQKIRKQADDEARAIVLDAQSKATLVVKEGLEAERRRGDEVVEEANRALDEKLGQLDEKLRQLSGTIVEVDGDVVEEASRRIVELVTSVRLFEERG